MEQTSTKEDADETHVKLPVVVVSDDDDDDDYDDVIPALSLHNGPNLEDVSADKTTSDIHMNISATNSNVHDVDILETTQDEYFNDDKKPLVAEALPDADRKKPPVPRRRRKRDARQEATEQEVAPSSSQHDVPRKDLGHNSQISSLHLPGKSGVGATDEGHLAYDNGSYVDDTPVPHQMALDPSSYPAVDVSTVDVNLSHPSRADIDQSVHANGRMDSVQPNKDSEVHFKQEENEDAQGTPLLGKQEEKEEISDRDRLDWDVFRSYQYDTSLYACEGLFKVATKILKVIFILISFGMILTSLVTSKLAILFATANINPHIGFRKNNLTTQGDDTVRWGVPVAYDDPGCKARDVARWLWCVMLCMCAPYVLSLLQSLWSILIKQKKNPTWSALGMVLLMETFHTVGLMMLFFIIMPTMDVFRGIFLMNATSLLPSFFKMFIRPKGEHQKGLNIAADVAAFIFQLAPLALFLGLTKYELDQGLGHFDTNSDYTCSADGMNGNLTDSFTCTAGIYTNYTYVNETYYTNNTYGNETLVDTNYTIYMEQYPVNDMAYEQCGPGPESYKDPALYLIPIALLLVSATWWLNFVDKNLKMYCVDGLKNLSKDIRKSKTKIYAVVYLWKLVLSFCLFFFGVFLFYGSSTSEFDMFGVLSGRESSDSNASSAFHDHRYVDNINEAFESDWLVVFAANAVSGLVGYFIAANSIKAKVQKAAYSTAILFATPVTVIIALFGFCECVTDKIENCMAEGLNIQDLYWNCYDGFDSFWDLMSKRPVVMLGVVWWLGQVILTRHIWTPQIERLAESGRIFIKPMYCGMLLEQSFALNRSRHDVHKKTQTALPGFHTDGHQEPVIHKRTEGNIRDRANTFAEDDGPTGPMMTEEPLYSRQDLTEPMVFLCATMWHESEREMLQMIKSIIRLDRDQCHRRLARQHFRVNIPDFYNFEGHIFFDDAFNQYVPGETEITVNRFVAMFVRIIDEAASFVHGANVVIDHPKKIPTPYGGKLAYVLPGGNLLYLHLKDKHKIRNRKRWSQVMYMYYLLGHRLWDQDDGISKKTKEKVAYNTFLLTLDGDVDFKPESVLLLVDLMRRNPSVGGACGRVHPTGNGPMVWYQKFEYAISHWLQKTTEHVLGCVLCNTGCFSLFRATALMDNNVLKAFSRPTTEAMHHVQHDQGEDRWLCTLLLQRGYSLEYSAAADALTYAPESFNELFNQRRRWIPSTFANIVDLLASGGTTSKRNQNISILYILYQGGLMFSAVLGPATIFMMVVSAFRVVFPNMASTGAFFLVFVPVVFYFCLCMWAKPGIQMLVGALLGGLFAMSQMVVLVALIVRIVDDGLCSPTAWFLVGTTSIFVISGILHPQEMLVLIYGIFYFLLIPTMYLLLMIYSLCNLHTVSWGTREVRVTNVEKQKLKQRELELTADAAAAAAPTGIMGMFGGLFGAKNTDGKEHWSLSCGDACRCMCCPRPGNTQRDQKLAVLENQIAILEGQIDRVISKDGSESSDSDADQTDALIRARPHSGTTRKSRFADSTNPLMEPATPQPDYDTEEATNVEEEMAVPEKSDIDPSVPYWTHDINAVGKGPIGELSGKEEDFWKHLIRRYLEPTEKNPDNSERMKKSLHGLRNKVVIAFFMIDILFIALLQTLQGITFDSNDTTYYLEFNCTSNGVASTHQIDPIGFAFLAVFGVFLVIQFIGMLFHRLFSLLQIVSSTVLCDKNKADNNMSYVKLAGLMAEMGEQGSDTVSMSSTVDGLDAGSIGTQRDVEADLAPQTNKVIKQLQSERKEYRTMDKIFAKRFLAMKREMTHDEVESNHEYEPTAPQPAAHIPRRPASLIRQPSKEHAPIGLARAKTRAHADVMYALARRRTDIFSQEKTQQLRNQYHLSDDAIEDERRHLAHRLPQVRDIRSFSQRSHMSDHSSRATGRRSRTGTRTQMLGQNSPALRSRTGTHAMDQNSPALDRRSRTGTHTMDQNNPALNRRSRTGTHADEHMYEEV